VNTIPICSQLAVTKDTLSVLLSVYNYSRWIDSEHSITEYCQTHGVDAAECVQQMRDRVRKEMNLTVSAGIAPNMVSVIL
jgi:nucleotidyltransferase/DNA polymerase involved in DNA repair